MDRKFVEDKVYLKGPSGVIYEYEPLLAQRPGFVPTVPNKSKTLQAAERKEASAAEEQAKKDAETQEMLRKSAEKEAATRQAAIEKQEAEKAEALKAAGKTTEASTAKK